MKKVFFLAFAFCAAITFNGCGDDADDNNPVVPTTTLVGDGVYQNGALQYRITNNAAKEVAVVGVADKGTLTTATIPQAIPIDDVQYTITSIESKAFFGCSKMKTVSIPATVKSIGSEAFYNCSVLASVTLPSGVTVIEDETFSGCKELASVNIPASITKIGGRAFYQCSRLASITIPAAVAEIGHMAFIGCTGLQSVTALRNDPAEYHCFNSAFSFDYTTPVLHVPAGCAEAYRAIEPWNKFDEIVEDAR